MALRCCTSPRASSPAQRCALTLGALGLLLTASCGGDAGLSPIDILPPSVNGVWATDCVGGRYGASFGAVISRTFTDPTFSAHTQIFATRWCDPGSALSTATLTGTYVIGERVMGNLENAIAIDLTVAELTLTLHDEADVAAANAAILGSGPVDIWKVDAPVRIHVDPGKECPAYANATCEMCVAISGVCVVPLKPKIIASWRKILAAYLLPELETGDVVFDIVKVTTQTLQIGELELGFITQQAARPIGLAEPMLFPVD